MMKKFFRPPPDEREDFFGLFHTLWDQGVGNRLRRDSVCGEKWTAESLSAAFEDHGQTVSERTIEGWHSGAHVPGPDNLRALIAIVSDAATRPAWRDALLTSARRARQSRRESGGTKTEHTSTTSPVSHHAAPAPTRRSALAGLGADRLVRIATVAAATAALLGAGGVAVAELVAPRVSDLRFCDVQHFSVRDRVCTRNFEHFDYGTKRIYVSFRLRNWPDDQKFTRTWYLNGASVLERSSLAAPPWEGWTWYGSADPEHPDAVAVKPGIYTLRVRAGKAIRAQTFEVATPSETEVGIRFRDPFHGGRGDGPEMVIATLQPEKGDLKKHRIAVSRSEISVADWQACVDDGVCEAASQPAGTDARAPVTDVSWDQAFSYLEWLNEKLAIRPERWDRYTLLTAAEWQSLASADTPPDILGLSNDIGEWVFDCAGASGTGASGPCPERLVLGTPAGRLQAPTGEKRESTGFRVVRRLDPLRGADWTRADD
ncbi:MAG: SUMF1/EgtB/PvdO family nonheme iron enzyme [Acidobacteria bacterium]|nr:SUMF1/EgtB/PvdO family nonheme iron enzyme [Acidobacteriota bacterium]